MMEMLWKYLTLGPVWLACVVMALVFAGFCTVVAMATLGRRHWAGLSHALLVEANYSLNVVGQDSARVIEEMHLQRLRSLDTGELAQETIRIAQEATHGRISTSLVKRCIAAVLGEWVTAEFSGIRSPEKRRLFVLGIRALVESERSKVDMADAQGILPLSPRDGSTDDDCTEDQIGQ